MAHENRAVKWMIGMGSNALASSVVLVCQPRERSAPVITRNSSVAAFAELPRALGVLEKANIAPVDVAQSAIGPGISIFTRALSVVKPDDSAMTINDALLEINQALDEYLSKDEGELDPETRFALTIYENYGYTERD